jgi:hypothetical protein
VRQARLPFFPRASSWPTTCAKGNSLSSFVIDVGKMHEWQFNGHPRESCTG